MGFECRLKTGFFETKRYDFLIFKGKLIFSDSESEDRCIAILESDILSITLRKVKSLEIEIQALDKIYHGTVSNQANFESMLRQLKENINKKIVCEHEGGY